MSQSPNDNTHSSEKTTHFGFKEVAWEDKSHKVAEVFHSVADSYDRMNDVMSLGIHRVWKKLTLELSGVKKGDKVLDIAGGTGDLAAGFAKKVGATGHVVLADINDSMLSVGRDRLIDKGIYQNVSFMQGDAQYLPFAENSFDCVIIGFGLRNVTDKDKALASMYRVLKPGGQCMILEFSKTTVPGFKKLYDWYSFKVLPKMGQLIAKDEESYRYLAESIRMHPDQETLKGMMQQAGFEGCRYDNMTGGIVALHRGYKY